MDCFVARAPRNDVERDAVSHSRGMICPRFSFRRPSTVEGAGNAGCALHPRSRVQDAQRKTHTSIQVQRRQSGIPCAMVLRLMPCSPRRRIRLVTVAGGLRLIKPGWADFASAELGTSNGCQDHTVLPYATSAVRPARCCIAHEKTALRTHLRANAAASTASHPAFVTIAIRPSCRERTGRAGRTDLPDGESEIFFARGLDRFLSQKLICPSRLGKNSAFSRVDVRFGS